MTLKKRYKRDLKHNMSLYVSSTLLTVLSLLLFYLYYISGAGITDYTEDIFGKQKIEDAHFGTYIEIPDKKINEYEKKYNIVLEKQHYINLETDGITARIFEKNKKADIPFITSGKYPEKNNEIAISEGYAINCNVKKGENIVIKKKNYKVTGYIERPDYLYMLQNLNDTDKNINSFFIAYMTDEEFRNLRGESVQYLVRYSKSTDIEKFRKEIHRNYAINSYVEAEDNHRITMLTAQPELFIQMAYAVLFTLPLMAVLLISIILSRKIRSEQKMIGTLSAYGYSRKQIIIHYAGFSAIPGIAGGILTTIVIFLTADSYGALGLMDYEPLKIDFRLELPQMILGITIPTIMYVLSTAFTVGRLMHHNITELLAGSVKGKSHTRKYLVGKKASFRIKFSVREILGNKGRTFALFAGVFLGGYVIMWGFAANDTLGNMRTETAESMGAYNYQYIMNEPGRENPYGGDAVLVSAAEDENGNNLTVFSTDEHSNQELTDEEGNRIEVKDGYIVTSLYTEISGKRKGDNVTLINPLSMERKEIRIEQVAENNFASAVYTSRENAAETAGVEKDCYNMILSKEKLDIPESEYSNIISRDKIDDQYKVIKQQMDVMVYAFLLIGIFLCIVSVYVVVNMIITENKGNISLLGVLGYNKKQINRLLIRDNIYVVIAATIISLPCAVGSVNLLFHSFTDILGYLIEAHAEPASYLYSSLLVFISYSISVMLVKRKIGKTEPVVSLKDNRE